MEWERIADFETYSTSSDGQVRNDKTGRILKPRLNTDGYYHVNLCKNGKAKNHKVHRLVALAFIPLEEGRNCVDHKDTDRTNNSLANLRWCTLKENQHNRSMSKNNTSGYKGVSFYKRDKKWRAEIKIDGKLIHLGYFDTAEEASAVRSARANQEFGEFTHSCESV